MEDRQQHSAQVTFFAYVGSSQITCLQLMAKRIAVRKALQLMYRI